MENPDADVVDTSDVDEREMFALSSPAASTSIKRTVASSQVVITAKDHPSRSPLTPITRRNRSNNYGVDDSSPRKRIKVTHNADLDLPSYTLPVTAEVILLDDGSAMNPVEQIRTPHRIRFHENEEQPPISVPARDVLPHSDDHSAFSASSQLSLKHDPPDATLEGWSQSMDTSLTSNPSPCSPSRSLSTPTDLYSLFSSPHHHPVTPPRSHDRSSSDILHVVTSSPLTPASSPVLLSQRLLRSPGPPLLLSPLRSQVSHHASPSNPPPADPHAVRSPPVIIPEDPHPLGRYSLRRREVRQMKPYAYENMLYRQQLKSHPDAIVKFRTHRRVDEGGTKDDFFVDNPDEDGDFMDVEVGDRRQKVRGHDKLGGDGEEPEAGPTDKGWLPDALKELSSDEGEGEIQKFARTIRKEREKAEALARAEARRAAANARQMEKVTKKVAKKRVKAFPVLSGAEQASTRPEERAPSLVLSSPLSLSSRAHSEPPKSSYPLSSIKSPSRPPAQSRAPFYSPASSSNRLSSPDYSVHLQQENFYRFDEQNVFVQDGSLVDHSAPQSPSEPPTTSGASALPSNTSEIDSESGLQSTSESEMNAKDRKRYRALKHMMPAAMVARELGRTKTAQRPPRARVPMESSGSEAEEVRLIPGLARVRKGKYKDVEVKGDTESSDSDRPSEVYDEGGEANIELDILDVLSDEQSSVLVRRTRLSLRPTDENDVISLSDSSGGESSEEREGSDDEVAPQLLFEHPAKRPLNEGSLIDWMLTRTRNADRPKVKSKQTAGSRKSRGPRARRLNVITDGARRYGELHQTLLPFRKADTSSKTTASVKCSSDRQVRVAPGAVKGDKQQRKRPKRPSKKDQGLVYNIHHDRTRITSRHHENKARQVDALVMDENDEEFRQAVDPEWKVEVERWNKSAFISRHPTAKSALDVQPVLRSRLQRQSSPQLRDENPLPCYFSRQEDAFASVQRPIVMNMNILPLPSGVKFGTSSYIGKGLLHQLVAMTSGNSDVAPPLSYNVQGFEIGPTTSCAVFNASLGPLFDRLTSALRDFRVDDADTAQEWDSTIRASSQLLSWLAIHSEDEEFFALEAALQEYSEGLLVVLETLETSVLSLSAHWFIVELSARIVCGIKYRRWQSDDGLFIRSAKHLIRHLLDVDLQPSFATFYAAEGDIDATSLSHRAAETWICLIHLLHSFDNSSRSSPGHSLWRMLADLHPETSPTGVDPSENLWRTLFSLCALSQFSVHGLSTSVFRLSAAWDLVAAALKKTTLTLDPEKDRTLTRSGLDKRDNYVSIVVSRCFLLWGQWGWRLDDGTVMFKSLQEIFRSRNFANLLTERWTPTGFIVNGNLEQLSKRDLNDTAFEIFLKMVVQAVSLLNENTGMDPKQRSAHIKKLLQMAVPVSPVPFTRSSPPSPDSLSMLVNRFTAMAIAVYLDPSPPNVKFRIGQAKRCVNFRDADDHSRTSCMYGMMNFAVIVRHHKIAGGLAEVLGWLGEMADVLMDEYKEGEVGSVRNHPTITLIQLLIGSVRRVIETSSLNEERSRAEYPDPALLDGPWITRVFNPRTDLITIQQTGVEIRMLVQSFLDARLKALPPPTPIIHRNESQESQDEYAHAYVDFEDEEVIAVLGDEAEASAVAELKSKEDALCKVLDKYITPAVYRLVCKYFSEREHTMNNTTTKAADEWIDCWVGCANVLVQNKYKEWGLYMKLGQQSWEKIVDDSWRRRIRLRFNLTLLRLDPEAYKKMSDEFIAVLLVATLSSKTPTIEHEFISTMLSLDNLQHPLLQGAPLDPVPGTRNYEVSQVDYEVIRERLIETVLTNTAKCLCVKGDAECQDYVKLIGTMLSTMDDIYQSAEDKKGYGEFCRRVFQALESHPELVLHPKLSDALARGRKEWNA